jgi:hypothetical protein
MSSSGSTLQKLLDSLRLQRLGSENDHPLVSPREAGPIMTELRTLEPLKALDEISDWFESLQGASEFKPDRRFEVLRQLDDLAQFQRIRMTLDQGAAATKAARDREARFWNISCELWARAAGAYVDMIERIERREKGVEGLRRDGALIAVRALRATGLRLKMLYGRYAPIPAELWVSLARAYRFAEIRGVQLTRLVPFSGVPGETSAEEELLRSLLLAASAPDALTPVQIDIAERVISGLAVKFSITTQPRPDSTCWFDLEKPRQPLRLAAPPAQLTSGLRFFATAAGFADVSQLLDRLEKSGEMPRGVDAGPGDNLQSMAAVLRHLRMNWAPRPPVRRTERRRTQGQIMVLHGLENILGTLRPPELDLDFGAPADAEAWTVDNSSNGGLGALAPPNVGDWLHIGALVAVQPDGTDLWQVAVVRRLSRDNSTPRGRASAGMQVLSRAPVLGVFTTVMGRWSNGVPTVEGLVIPESGEAGSILVGMPTGLYLPGEQLLAMINEKRHLLFPVALVERGTDYDLIKFRAMVQED